jgi:pimeloyl-ACP methyl ester carboxylesterase
VRYLPRLASLLLVPTLLTSASAERAPPSLVGSKGVVGFSEYPASAEQQELARRTLSPLAAIARHAAAAPPQSPSIDLTRERFLLYVPRVPADRGYRLLVFVPPWNDAKLPSDWAPVLEREHTIFVTATESGNGISIFSRREPLALIAAENVLHQFPVDRDRVYVGGFSGGARVALRLALGYPDLFRGVLLDAGSDPIGDAQAPLPPAELFRTFQQSTRLVFLTGDDDDINIEHDAESRLSMMNGCVYDLHTMTISHADHSLTDSLSLRRALDTLLADQPPASLRRLTACRARIERELAADMAHVLALLHRDRPQAARALLRGIDARYGGLAAPQSIDVAKQIATAH